MRRLVWVWCGAANILATAAVISGVLAGCADNGPTTTKIGRDTYRIFVRVPFNGPTGAKGQALMEANAFCAKSARQMLLYHEHSYQCALYDGCGEAVAYFLCVTQDDPRYKAQYLRPLDEGVYIIENP